MSRGGFKIQESEGRHRSATRILLTRIVPRAASMIKIEREECQNLTMMAEGNKGESCVCYYQIHTTLKTSMLRNWTTLTGKCDTKKLKTILFQNPL